MHVKDNVYAALQFKRLLSALAQGGRDLVKVLAYAKLCEKLYGWPEAIGKAALADQRALIMPSMQSRRDELGAEVYKASVSSGTTTDGAFAGPLVRFAQYGTGWLASLINQSLFEAVAALARPLPINTRFAFTSGIGTGANPAESGWSGVTKFNFSGAITVAQHVDAIFAVSNDLLRFKAVYAEELLNAELAHCVTLASDKVAAGILLDGLSLPTSGGDAPQDLSDALDQIDLGQMSKALIFTSPAVVKHLGMLRGTSNTGPPAFPDVVIPNGGSINGMPLMGCDVLSNYNGEGDVLMVVDASQGCAADSGVVVADTATSGSIQMSDSSLGSPSEGAELVSLFQDDATALKLQRWFSLVRIRTTSVGAVKGCSYSLGSP